MLIAAIPVGARKTHSRVQTSLNLWRIVDLPVPAFPVKKTFLPESIMARACSCSFVSLMSSFISKSLSFWFYIVMRLSRRFRDHVNNIYRKLKKSKQVIDFKLFVQFMTTCFLIKRIVARRAIFFSKKLYKLEKNAGYVRYISGWGHYLESLFKLSSIV